jgi:hypothetical protein
VAEPPLALELRPDRQNPTSPAMGDHMRFWSTITNVSATPVEGLVAWISLVEVDPGNEQPVDLEDWSAQKAVTGAYLAPGQCLQTDWPVRLIKGGDYRVVISVTDHSSHVVYTSPTVQFHVKQKPVLSAGRVLPVAAGIPVLIAGLMLFNRTQRREKSRAEEGGASLAGGKPTDDL